MLCRFFTFTDLKYAVEHHFDAVTRCLKYVEDKGDGSKYADRFFKFLMDTSLLYRCFPSDSLCKQ